MTWILKKKAGDGNGKLDGERLMDKRQKKINLIKQLVEEQRY